MKENVEQWIILRLIQFSVEIISGTKVLRLKVWAWWKISAPLLDLVRSCEVMWGHVDPLHCSVVLYSLSFFNSLRIKRSTSATWPQEAGKSVKFWPMMRAQTWCKHKLLTSRHLSKQHRIWPLNLQIDFVISSYFLSTEEGSARRHMYRYTYQFPVKCQSTAVFYIMDIRCWCIEINSWWLKMLIKSLQKT